MKVRLAYIFVIVAIVIMAPATVEGDLFNNWVSNSLIGWYMERMPQGMKLPSLFSGKIGNPALAQLSDYMQPFA